MSTRDRLCDRTLQEPESEQEDAHHDEEGGVFEPGVVKCKVEKDPLNTGDQSSAVSRSTMSRPVA